MTCIIQRHGIYKINTKIKKLSIKTDLHLCLILLQLVKFYYLPLIKLWITQFQGVAEHTQRGAVASNSNSIFQALAWKMLFSPIHTFTIIQKFRNWILKNRYKLLYSCGNWGVSNTCIPTHWNDETSAEPKWCWCFYGTSSATDQQLHAQT